MTEPTSQTDDEETRGLLAKVREKQYAQENLAHDKVNYGPDSARTVPSLERVGRLEHDLGDDAGARGHYQRALEIEEASAGAEDPDAVHSREELKSIRAELKALEETVPTE